MKTKEGRKLPLDPAESEDLQEDNNATNK